MSHRRISGSDIHSQEQRGCWYADIEELALAPSNTARSRETKQSEEWCKEAFSRSEHQLPESPTDGNKVATELPDIENLRAEREIDDDDECESDWDYGSELTTA